LRNSIIDFIEYSSGKKAQYAICATGSEMAEKRMKDFMDRYGGKS
jgi:hypothetical protein